MLGALALAGGAAAALRVSPLAVGLVAGLFWTIAPGRADQIVQDDLRACSIRSSCCCSSRPARCGRRRSSALWLLAPYLLFRLAGKIAGAWVTARFVDVQRR